MERYQPEFIEEQTVKAILESCVPFFEKKAGRFWLDQIDSFRVKELIAIGLNSLDETGTLDKPIALRMDVLKHREEARKLNDKTNEYNNEIFKKLEEVNLTPEQAHNLKLQLMHYVDESPIDPTEVLYEINLFNSWQKAIEADSGIDQNQNGKYPSSCNLQEKPDTEQIDNSILLIPISIKKLADSELIQETAEGSHVFINQKESLEALKSAIKSRKLDYPLARDVHTFIVRIENGVPTRYDSSFCRRVFKRVSPQ